MLFPAKKTNTLLLNKDQGTPEPSWKKNSSIPKFLSTGAPQHTAESMCVIVASASASLDALKISSLPHNARLKYSLANSEANKSMGWSSSDSTWLLVLLLSLSLHETKLKFISYLLLFIANRKTMTYPCGLHSFPLLSSGICHTHYFMWTSGKIVRKEEKAQLLNRRYLYTRQRTRFWTRSGFLNVCQESEEGTEGRHIIGGYESEPFLVASALN